MEEIEKLKEYFQKEEDVILAFIFGSRAKKMERPFSDWDIAVYFKPYLWGETETRNEYPQEEKIWREIERILKSEVDFLVLNRARPSLVFSILNSGLPLVIKDRKLYLKLLIKTHYEAVDYWKFAKEFYEISERSKFLSEEDKSVLIEHLKFLEAEEFFPIFIKEIKKYI